MVEGEKDVALIEELKKDLWNVEAGIKGIEFNLRDARRHHNEVGIKTFSDELEGAKADIEAIKQEIRDAGGDPDAEEGEEEEGGGEGKGGKGKELEDKKKKKSKAAKAGKAVGKFLTGEKSEPIGKGWWIVAIIFLLTGTIVGYVLAWTYYGFITGLVAFLVTLGFKKFRDKYKGTRLYSIVMLIFIFFIISGGISAYTFLFAGTGFEAEVSHYTEGAQVDVESRAGLMAEAGRWFHCNVEAPGTCIEADKIIDGGIFIKNVGTDFTFSEGDAIEVNGNLDYELYDTGISAAGEEEKEAAEEELDYSQKNVTVYAEWQDKDYLRDVWTCQQPQGAKSDFTCWYDAGVIKSMRAKDMCGIDFVSMRETAAGTMHCKADVSVNYYSKTKGFRQLVLSNYPQDVDWSGEGKTDYLWSGAGPVIVTIGSHGWDTSIRPAIGRNKTIPIKITPDIKLKEKTYVTPMLVIITIQQRPGLNVYSDDCEVSVDEASNAIICTQTSDFGLDELDKTTVDGIELKIKLGFEEDMLAYSESLKVEMWADFEYEVITKESATVDIKYNMADDDLLAAQVNSTLSDHGCGYDASCMERIFKKTDTCAEPVCRATTTKLFGKRVRCVCFEEDFPVSVYCCNGIACASALTGTFSKTQQDTICDSFNVEANLG